MSENTISYIGENTISFAEKSCNNIIKIENQFIAKNLKIVIKGNNNIIIFGKNTRFTGHILVVGNNRTVKIGNHTTAQGVYILSREEDIIIGENCMLSREIEIRSTDVHKIYDIKTCEHLNPAKKVIIGNNVWVGARAMLSKGCVIPNGCIVGATSFVNKEFYDENVIIAGTPAKIVKRDIYWER